MYHFSGQCDGLVPCLMVLMVPNTGGGQFSLYVPEEPVNRHNDQNANRWHANLGAKRIRTLASMSTKVWLHCCGIATASTNPNPALNGHFPLHITKGAED